MSRGSRVPPFIVNRLPTPARLSSVASAPAVPPPPARLSAGQVEAAERIVGHVFADPALLAEALTHSSIADHRLHSNERMEFLGDAVLDLVVVEALYRLFPGYSEGDLTKVKSAVVSRKTCAEIAVGTGLASLLVTGKGIAGRNAGLPGSLAAAVYEAIVAAIYLDAGFDAAKAYVLRTMDSAIRRISDDVDRHNYKSTLQEHAQRLLGGTPQYELLDEKGPDHSKCFEVCVTVRGRRFEPAWGTNKKIAEQKAALKALEQLGVISHDEASQAIDAAELAAD